MIVSEMEPAERRKSVTAQFDGDTITFERMREVAVEYWGERGAFVYDGYQWANAMLFQNRIRVPMIQWALTPHGRNLGQIYPFPERPVVTLHPGIWHRGKLRPRRMHQAWGGIWAGQLYALDVLIHELLHAYVECILVDDGLVGPARPRTPRWQSCHNNDWWADEVSRLSPKLSLGEVTASRTKRKRTKQGMRTVPCVEGSISMDELAHWPWSLRDPSYAQTGLLPFDWNSVTAQF
jgi:hypothetical protein